MSDLRPKKTKNHPSLLKKKGLTEKKMREEERSDD